MFAAGWLVLIPTLLSETPSLEPFFSNQVYTRGGERKRGKGDRLDENSRSQQCFLSNGDEQRLFSAQGWATQNRPGNKADFCRVARRASSSSSFHKRGKNFVVERTKKLAGSNWEKDKFRNFVSALCITRDVPVYSGEVLSAFRIFKLNVLQQEGTIPDVAPRSRELTLVKRYRHRYNETPGSNQFSKWSFKLDERERRKATLPRESQVGNERARIPFVKLPMEPLSPEKSGNGRCAGRVHRLTSFSYSSQESHVATWLIWPFSDRGARDGDRRKGEDEGHARPWDATGFRKLAFSKQEPTALLEGGGGRERCAIPPLAD
ncbi:hypothetical protein WH47_03552 [Habropoda laboriosa]|uniref:Uncharacterized protein n=1 Tax=Habropoda laboriosa TaxID=597456 RepID=A0A0L7RC31_9HYME|nr:hypothetical protein WH47_03552 [Habropoda laboriosa]